MTLDWAQLAKLPLSTVLDFDPETAVNGVYYQVKDTMNRRRSLHLWTDGNVTSMVPEKACYWFAARGLSSRPNTKSDDYRAWNRRFGRKQIPALMSEFAKGADGRPVTVICAWFAPKYVSDICSIVDAALLDSVDFVFAVPDSERYQDISASYDSTLVSIGIAEILQGVSDTLTDYDSDAIPSSVPRADGTKVVIDPPQLRWLTEDLEVLYEGIESHNEEEDESADEFLRGAVITWAGLSQHLDADRDMVTQLQQVIQKELEKRSRTRINLYHVPGAGGTTIARRIAWNLHRSYPTVQLRRIEPQHTIHKIDFLFQETKSPIMILVEGADVIAAELDRFYDELQNANISFVILVVRRTFGRPTPGERVRTLNQSLSNFESYSFLQTYKTAATAAGAEARLESIHRAEGSVRTPFNYAFTSFREDYLGIHSYVASRLGSCTLVQRQLLTYLALAYYYGHKPVLSQVFAAFLGVPERRKVRLESHLTDIQRDLLLEEGDCMWRPIHQEIAKQILVASLTGEGEDSRNWKHHLPQWGSDFIRTCSIGSAAQSDALVDLVRRVVILRDENEILGTESSVHSNYGALIEDIQTDEGKLSVLHALVEEFPDEAHFAGHLGRFYSITMNAPKEALKYIERAIQLEPDDSVLHHMKGMCYRKLAQDTSYKYQGESDLTKAEKRERLQTIRTAVEKGSDAFAQARELNPNTEHPYISEIQMILKVLDNLYVASGVSSRVAFLSDKSALSTWCQELLDDAETLLEQVARAREGESQSSYVMKVRADLDQIYDNYSRAIEGWTNLLSRQGVFGPPLRRQIVRAYLARKNREWSKLPQQEVSRIVDLMEDNLREEPGSERNIRLWFRAIRHHHSADINLAIDRISHWRTTGDSVDAYYYLYVLHALKAIEGSLLEAVKTQGLVEQCARRARNLRFRTRSYEWLGYGRGLQRLVNSTELGEWDPEIEFYTNSEKLVVLEGIIKRINAPESGILEISGSGLEAFFVPARADAAKGRDENAQVTFFLGFSYDGLRAWSVDLV
ncbi:MAG: hypothetical protein M9928_14415 [Anaerolineae bacterium]|nr:hypothetical protein [Anaerolineae bacterium]